MHPLFKVSVSMERNSVGGKHGREGFVSRMLCCPEPGTLSHFVPSGAQGGLAVKLLSGSGGFFCPIPRKEVRPHAHFVREKVCFPSRTAAPSRPSVFGFLIGSWRGRRWQQLARLPSPGDGHCTALSALAVHVSQSSHRAFLCGRHCFPLIS